MPVSKILCQSLAYDSLRVMSVFFSEAAVGALFSSVFSGGNFRKV